MSAPEIRLVKLQKRSTTVRLMAACQARNCVTSSSQGETDSGSPRQFRTLCRNSRSSLNPRVNLIFDKEERSR